MKKTLHLSKKPLIGIDISQTYVRAMAIEPTHNRVIGYGAKAVDPIKVRESFHSDGAYLGECLSALLSQNIVGKLTSNHAVITIPTTLTYSRSLLLPLDVINNLEEAVMLEAEQYIPVAIDELNVSFEILEKTDKNIELLISAAPKKIIGNIVSACEAAGLIPLVVETNINSVARLVTLTEEGYLPTIVVDINNTTTDLAIIKNRLHANATADVGGNTFTRSLARTFSISSEAAHQLKTIDGLSHGPKRKKILQALDPTLMIIVNEIDKMIHYHNSRLSLGNPIQQVIIVGIGSTVLGLGEYFTDKLTLPARVANPWQTIHFDRKRSPSKQFRNHYLTVAGAAYVSHEEKNL